jgi:hypothetical protein
MTGSAIESLLPVTILGETVHVSLRAREILVDPLVEVLRQTAGYLSPEACARFLEIYDYDATGEVYKVPDDFVRHSDHHREYRELRHSLLIRPRAGGQWDPGKEVEVCPFSHLLLKQHQDLLVEKAATVGARPPA